MPKTPTKQKKFEPTTPMKCKRIAEILFEDKSYACINNEYYQYKEKGKNIGVWEHVSYDYIEAITSELYEKEWTPSSTSNLKEVLRFLRNITELTFKKEIKKLAKKPLKNEINLKSGILDLKTFELRRYKREDFVFTKLPFDYKEDYECPLFTDFIKNCFKNEKFDDDEEVFDFIQEWMGYSFLPGNKYERCLILHGEGGKGKGTLMGIWTKIVGRSNVSYLDVSDINDQGHIESTRDKLINFSGDLKHGQQIDTGLMKSAISGEMVRFNTKYKKMGEFMFTAKPVIMGNNPPWIKDTGSASRRRLNILECNGADYEKKDHDIKHRFDDEIEAIFCCAIEGLRRLIKNNNFTKPERLEDELDKYMTDNDPIQQWLEERKLDLRESINKESQVLRATAYRDYREYARTSGYMPLNKKNFFQEMQKKKFECRLTSGGWKYIGLKNPETSEFE